MLRIFCGLVFIFCAFFEANADFIKTRASGMYFAPGGQVAVALSHKDGAEGIFIVAGNLPPAQEFDLEALPKEGLVHVFIRFSGGSYSEIIIGERSYKLTGNATLKLADLVTVGLDNNNPFLSIVTEGKASANGASILGFIGLTQVVSGGRGAAAILAANLLDPSIASLIKPYNVQPDGLSVGDKLLNTRTVGVLVEPPAKKVNCLKPDTIYLDSDQLDQVQASKSEDQRLKLLDQFVKENKKTSPAEGLLFLRTIDESVIALKVSDQSVKQIKELKKAGTTKNSHRICVVVNLPLVGG